MKCPACGEGILIQIQEDVIYSYKYYQGKVKLFHSECDTCNSELTNSHQSKYNKFNILNFRNYIDNFEYQLKLSLLIKLEN